MLSRDGSCRSDAGTGPVDATAVTAYPSLAICEGTLSFQNGAPAAYGVAGALKLVGGARAVVDLTAEGVDAFTVAGTVDLSEASAANPFVFSVVLVGDVTLDANGVTLVSAGFSAGDEAKVRIEEPLDFAAFVVIRQFPADPYGFPCAVWVFAQEVARVV